MPSIYDVKPRFQALLHPLIRAFAGVGLTANGVTLLALLGSFGVGAALVLGRDLRWILVLVPAWLFIRMALNAIDGMMARELDMKSDLGAILNEVGDVLSDAALYLPLAALSPASLWPIVAFVLGAATTEFCGVLALTLGASRRYDGPMGKSDRAFWVGALALCTLLYPPALGQWPWCFGILAGLALVTCWLRCSRALTQLREGRA